MITIEKDVPIPIARHKDGDSKGLRAALSAMEIGDSFFYPTKDPVRCGVRSQICRVSKETHKNFTTRKVDGGIRVWRLE